MYTDQDIAALRDRIVHLEGQIAFLYRHLGVTFVPEAAAGDHPKVIEALKKGNLLEAIMVYRTVHSTSTVSVSLDDARRAVEEMKGRLGI